MSFALLVIWVGAGSPRKVAPTSAQTSFSPIGEIDVDAGWGNALFLQTQTQWPEANGVS